MNKLYDGDQWLDTTNPDEYKFKVYNGENDEWEIKYTFNPNELRGLIND